MAKPKKGNKFAGRMSLDFMKSKGFLFTAAAMASIALVVGMFSMASNNHQKYKRFNTPGKEIALTFDDGPASTSVQMSQILHQNGAVGTFFFVGSRVNSKTASVVQKVSNDGNEIGIHAFDHHGTWGPSEQPMNSSNSKVCTIQLNKANQAIQSVISYHVYWVRAPKNIVSDTCLDQVYALGYKYASWSGSLFDDKGQSQDQIEKLAVKNAKPGAILTMHDNNPNTVKALPNIIKKLKSQGYTFKTLSQMYADQQSMQPQTSKFSNTLSSLKIASASASIKSPANNKSIIIGSGELVRVGANVEYKSLRIFIKNSAGKEVGDTQWINTKPTTSWSMPLERVFTTTLLPGTYQLSAQAKTTSGKTISTPNTTFSLVK